MRASCAGKEKTPKTEDSLADGAEFELSADFQTGQ
jgi:hypothetical protein